jgi:hypothetical protein
MSRALIVVKGNADRQRVLALAAKVPTGTRVEFKAAKRTLPQNDLMWSRLTEISRQVVWHGERLTPNDWKDIFTASLRHARVVPGIDPGSTVLLGLRTSDMSKDEMAQLLDRIDTFAAEAGITFNERDAA